MLARIASFSASSLAVALGLIAATGCAAMEKLPGREPKAPVERYMLAVAGDEGGGVFQFDRGGVTFRADGADAPLKVRNGPSGPLGAPIASCSSQNMAAAVYPAHVIRIDKLKDDVFCNAPPRMVDARAVGMTDKRLAVVAGKKLRIFEPDDFRLELETDVSKWLKEAGASQLTFALPLEGGNLMLVGHRGKGKLGMGDPARTVVHVVALVTDADGKLALDSTPAHTDGVPDMALHTCAHDGGTVYVAGRLALEESNRLVVRSYTGSPWDCGQVIGVDWPKRTNSSGKLVQLGAIKHMVVGHGLIVLLHKGGALTCYRGEEVVATAVGVQAAAILSSSRLETVQDGEIVPLSVD
jgi:hypothetical protein